MMFLEYIWLAWSGTGAGGLGWSDDRHALCWTSLVGAGQFAVAAALGRQITTTEPGAMASTISVVMQDQRLFAGNRRHRVTT